MKEQIINLLEEHAGPPWWFTTAEIAEGINASADVIGVETTLWKLAHDGEIDCNIIKVKGINKEFWGKA